MCGLEEKNIIQRNCFPLFLLTKEAQEKKLTKRECRKESFARCDGRPKAPPLETASFWKSSTKTTHQPRHVVSGTSLLAKAGVWGPRAIRLATSKVSSRGMNATLIIKNFSRVGYTLVFLKKTGGGQNNKSIWLKGFGANTFTVILEALQSKASMSQKIPLACELHHLRLAFPKSPSPHRFLIQQPQSSQ